LSRHHPQHPLSSYISRNTLIEPLSIKPDSDYSLASVKAVLLRSCVISRNLSRCLHMDQGKKLCASLNKGRYTIGVFGGSPAIGWVAPGSDFAASAAGVGFGGAYCVGGGGASVGGAALRAARGTFAFAFFLVTVFLAGFFPFFLVFLGKNSPLEKCCSPQIRLDLSKRWKLSRIAIVEPSLYAGCRSFGQSIIELAFSKTVSNELMLSSICSWQFRNHRSLKNSQPKCSN